MTPEDSEMLARFIQAAVTGLCANPEPHGHNGKTVAIGEIGEAARKVGESAFVEWKIATADKP